MRLPTEKAPSHNYLGIFGGKPNGFFRAENQSETGRQGQGMAKSYLLTYLQPTLAAKESDSAVCTLQIQCFARVKGKSPDSGKRLSASHKREWDNCHLVQFLTMVGDHLIRLDLKQGGAPSHRKGTKPQLSRHLWWQAKRVFSCRKPKWNWEARSGYGKVLLTYNQPLLLRSQTRRFVLFRFNVLLVSRGKISSLANGQQTDNRLKNDFINL